MYKITMVNNYVLRVKCQRIKTYDLQHVTHYV